MPHKMNNTVDVDHEVFADPEPPKHEAQQWSGPVQIYGSREARLQLVQALAAAQETLDTIGKGTTGQVGKRNFSYSNLLDIMRVVRPALKSHGLCVLQPISSSPLGEEWQSVTTIIAGHGAEIVATYDYHRRAQEMDDKNDGSTPVQRWGKVLTYVRRYAIQSMFVLQGDADADDGPGGPPRAKPQPRREVQEVQERMEAAGTETRVVMPASDAQIAEIRKETARLGIKRKDVGQYIDDLGFDRQAVKDDSEVADQVLAKLRGTQC